MTGSSNRGRALLVAGTLAAAFAAFGPAPAVAGGNRPDRAPVCSAIVGPDPFMVRLVPTAKANGASGTVEMRWADSPFGVTVTPDGHHAYAAEVSTSGLRRNGDVLIVWAATPQLDKVTRLGALNEQGRLSGTIALNKFLVFVTAESSADVERWSGPILLRGASASARMHTMAGHGPFTTESCRSWGFGPGGSDSGDSTQ